MPWGHAAPDPGYGGLALARDRLIRGYTVQAGIRTSISGCDDRRCNWSGGAVKHILASADAASGHGREDDSALVDLTIVCGGSDVKGPAARFRKYDG